jgi:hypothetical protein
MTFARFKAELAKQGCAFRQGSQISDSAGNSHTITYLQRTVDGKDLEYAILLEDKDQIEAEAIRTVCRHLNFDPREFGLPSE